MQKNVHLLKAAIWHDRFPLSLKKHINGCMAGESRYLEMDDDEEIIFTDFLSDISEKVNKQIINDFLRLLFMYEKFQNGGKKFIQISNPSLKEQLFNTDINKMTIDNLHTPFPCFFVELNLPIISPVGNKQVYILEGAFVEVFEDRIHICTLENNGSKITSPMMTYLDIFKGQDIYSQIERIANDFTKDYPQELKALDSVKKHDHHIISVLTKIFSVLFYLDYAEKEKREKIREVDEWKPYRKKLSTFSKKTNIKRAKALHYIKLEGSLNNSTGTNNGTKQTKMTLVKGHWRRQPYGTKEEKLHKVIWIKPFWKNLDEEKENVVHEYILK